MWRGVSNDRRSQCVVGEGRERALTCVCSTTVFISCSGGRDGQISTDIVRDVVFWLSCLGRQNQGWDIVG